MKSPPALSFAPLAPTGFFSQTNPIHPHSQAMP